MMDMDEWKKYSKSISDGLSNIGMNTQRTKIYEAYVRQVESLDIYCSGRFKYMCVGSGSDGTQANRSDEDRMHVIPNIFVQTMINDDKTTFCPKSSILIAEHSDLGFGFSHLRFHPQFDRTVIPRVNYVDMYLKSADFIQMGLRESSNILPSYASDIQLKSEGTSITGGNEENSSDGVLAIECLEWPRESKEWCTRKRSYEWPGNQLIETIRQSKCYVIPDAKHDPYSWRFAFPVAERELMWSLNDVQLQCYTVLKQFKEVKFSVVAPDEISSFHLKMALFWLLEKTPKDLWVPEHFFDCLRKYLHTLRKYIENKELPHYFITKRNTLCSKLKDDQTRKSLIHEMEYIERNIVDEMKVMKIDFFNESLQQAGKQMAANHTSENLDRTAQISQTILNVDLYVAFNNCLKYFQFVVNTTVIAEGASELLLLLQDVYRKLTNKPDKNSVRYLTFIRDYIKIRIGINLYREALSSNDETHRLRLLQEAANSLLEGKSMDGFTGSLYLVSFYIASGKCMDASKVVNKLLSTTTLYHCAGTYHFIFVEKGNAEIVNGYYFINKQMRNAVLFFIISNEMHMFPLSIRYECSILILGRKHEKHELFEDFVVHPLVYLKLLQFLIHKELKLPDTMKRLEDFSKIVADSIKFEKSTYYINLNILGHCYMTMGRVHEAYYCFVKSLDEYTSEHNVAVYHLCVLFNYMFSLMKQRSNNECKTAFEVMHERMV